VIVNDIMTHPNWVPYRELAEKEPLRVCWSEPIRSNTHEVLGALAMYYREPREPANSDLEFLQTIAQVAGIAIERKRTEELLQRDQEFLKTILENTNEMIVACDADGVLTLFNRAAREWHGIPEQPVPSEERARPSRPCS